jgi:hypothetical protein
MALDEYPCRSGFGLGGSVSLPGPARLIFDSSITWVNKGASQPCPGGNQEP